MTTEKLDQFYLKPEVWTAKSDTPDPNILPTMTQTLQPPRSGFVDRDNVLHETNYNKIPKSLEIPVAVISCGVGALVLGAFLVSDKVFDTLKERIPRT